MSASSGTSRSSSPSRHSASPEMTLFTQWCGYSLALSHARSGEPAVISGYLGKGDAFDKAVAAFSVAYADQNESDHAALKRAIHNGEVEAVIEEAK